MKYFFLLLWFQLFFLNIAPAQSRIISGFVQDAATGERLPGANIFLPATKFGIQTNSYGFFSIKLPEQNNNVEVSYLGYQAQKIELPSSGDTSLMVKLLPQSIEIGEVTIDAHKHNMSTQRVGSISLSTSRVEKIPVILGERDLLKAYQLLPGVQSGIEGTSGMVVRGSDPGQNLILLDGVPVYNASHLFGVFSVFNTDAIKSSTLIKGAFPARFGGRVSSVLDIRMKEGNNQEFKGVVSIGLISSRIFLEGPLLREKTSFMFSARRSYIDLLLNPYQRVLYQNKSLMAYSFYDINLKLNHIVNEKNRLYASIYTGNDHYQGKTSYTDTYLSQQHKQLNGFDWGNLTSTLRWNLQPGPKMFINTTLIYSKYAFHTRNHFQTINTQDKKNILKDVDVKFTSGIKDYGANIDVNYQIGLTHQLQFGAVFSTHEFTPGSNIADFNQLGQLLKADTIDHQQILTNNELAVYFEDEWSVTTRLKVEAGLRYTAFFLKETNYQHIEPRLFVMYLTGTESWLGMAYSRISQHIHLLTNSSIGFPSDQWLPVTPNIKPIVADHFNITFQKSLGKGYQLHTEGFIKSTENVLEYVENANMKENWKDIVEQGRGQAYGVEFLLKKETGKLTGWLAYTWSKSDRQFDKINNGKVFPYKYDRRHDFKIALTYPLTAKSDFGANWVFTTGHAVTLPLDMYYAPNSFNMIFNEYNYNGEIFTYSERNNFRMPAYHRLDLSLNIHKTLRYYQRTISIGLYNAYARHNAMYYDFYDGKLRSIGVLPIVPSINYVARF